MDKLAERLKAYIDTHPFDPGDSDCETVLDQLYQAYSESHESDPPEIREGFKELDELLGALPLDDNNTVFNLCCSLCSAYERKAFIDGVQYGMHLMLELWPKKITTEHTGGKDILPATGVFFLLSAIEFYFNISQT